MTSFVRIALAGAGSFAEVNIVEGDTISRLAKRVCAEFPHWGTADKLSLYLVAAGGDEEPVEEAISAVLSSGGRLGVGWPLSRAGISSGAWLVARKIADGGALGAFPFQRVLCPSFCARIPPPAEVLPEHMARRSPLPFPPSCPL